MKNNETIFKGKITNINHNGYTESIEDVLFRVISVDNIYFFAEEIITGAIFPVYEYVSRITGNIPIKSNSYLETGGGSYYIYYPTTANDEIFKYKLDERPGSDTLQTASIEDINKYLRRRSNNSSWKQKIKKLEKINIYMCDLNLIKEKIASIKKGNMAFNFNSDNIQYEFGAPKINIDSIAEFGIDLSTQKDLCNLIDREREINKIIRTLAISGDSVLLVGPRGSGKTAIAEKIAADTRDKNNKWLKDKIIFSVNPATLITDTKYRGKFEEKFKKLLDFCVEHKNQIILFIDEIHILYGLGRTEDSAIDAMNILKPYLSRGDLTIFGATTEEEYQKHMLKDPAFIDRWEKVEITIPTTELNIKILLDFIKELEKKYNIKLNINEEYRYYLIEYIVNITDQNKQRKVGDISLSNPRISKKLLKDAFTQAIFDGKKAVTLEEICFSILDCDKLSPTFRKEKAKELKKILNESKIQGKKSILELKPQK